MVFEPPDWRDELVSSVDDPDFGALDLWRTTSTARVPRATTFTWRGELPLPDGLRANISITGSQAEMDRVDESYRAAYRRLVAREPDVRKRVAERIMPLAIKWAENIDIVIGNAQQLSSWLRLDAITMSPEEGEPQIAFWYEERSHDIFAGHSIQALFNLNGDLVDAHLAG